MEAFEKAIKPNTKLIFGEVVGNPGAEVLDIPAVSEMAHNHGLPIGGCDLCNALLVQAY